MHDLKAEHAAGVLRHSWYTEIGDYAIAGGWAMHGKMLAVADSAGDIYMLDAATGEITWTYQQAHTGGILALAIHPDGNMFTTAGQDGRAVIWSSSRGQVHHEIKVGDSWVENISWSQHGHWLAISCGRRVSVYEGNNNQIWQSDDHPSTISAIDWWSSQELVTTCYGQVAFFDIPTGDLRQQLNWKGSLVSMALNRDSDIVACASQDNSVHFWRRSTAEDSTMSGYPGKPSTITFNNSGTLLATTGGNNVTVWSFEGDGPEGTEPGVLAFHEKFLTTVAFSHNGKYLASGSRDGVIVVWLVQQQGNGQPVGISLVKGSVAALHWREDDCVLVALDSHGGITAWHLQ